MKIAVLGSSGQIGSHLTKYLQLKNHTVYEFDIVNNKQEDLTIFPNKPLEDIIKKSDFVFFLAFDVGGSKYLNKYQHTFEFIDNNAKIMSNTFNYIKKYNKRFIFTSTQMSNMIHSQYGVLKSIGEYYTKSLNGIIVKLWNVYGIEKNYEKSHVITDFIIKGFEKNNIDMITDGQEERQFLYVEDCCKAFDIIMSNYNEFTSYDKLHITSFKSTKIIQIAKIIQSNFKLINRDVSISPSKNTDNVQRNMKNVPDKYILKWWNPETSIEIGIKKIFDEISLNY